MLEQLSEMMFVMASTAKLIWTFRKGSPPSLICMLPPFTSPHLAMTMPQFMALNPVSARLFSMLQEQGERNGAALLRRIAEELQHPDPVLVVESGHAILEQWREMGIVRGIRRKK